MKRFFGTAIVSFALLVGNVAMNFCLAEAAQAQGIDQNEAVSNKPAQLEKVTVVIEGEDVLKQEGIHDWAGKASQLVTEYFPKFNTILDSKENTPPKEITLVFRKMDGVAYSTGTSIVMSADWIKRQPGDFGMVAHELVHVIQHYPRRTGPGWVTEGIADYMRHIHFEPEALMRPANPDRDKYTDQYQITAGFFMWIAHTFDKEFVTKLNIAMRERTYSDEIFEKITEKKLDDLWKEYSDFLRKIGERPRLLPAEMFDLKK